MGRGNNKIESVRLRKRFKKSDNYRCCGVSGGNVNKLSRGMCCTYPQWYIRHDRRLNALLDTTDATDATDSYHCEIADENENE